MAIMAIVAFAMMVTLTTGLEAFAIFFRALRIFATAS
jgi:hypothetical protein